MQAVDAVLREKEIAIERIRQEVEALRLVCHLLDDEDQSTPNPDESDLALDEKVVEENALTDKREESLAEIRERFLYPTGSEIKSASGRNVLLQFRQAALGASRTFVKRVRDSRSELEIRWKTFIELFERPERSNAA